MKLYSIVSLACISVFAFGSMASADNGQWKKNHPRRAEVLRRDKRLNNRTERAEKNGKITKGQGDKLEKEEGAIRNQEQADAAANGGHITKAEQRDLNREENGVKNELKRDERKDRRAKRKEKKEDEAPVAAPTN